MTTERADPYLDAGMHGYIRNKALKEFWRVSGWYSDVSDLVQDGYFCYAKCRNRYVDTLGVLPATNPSNTDRRHMMSLVMTTFDRYICHNIAGQLRYGREVPVSQFTRNGEDADTDPWNGLVSAGAEDVAMMMLIKSLPSEIQDLISILTGDGSAALEFCYDRLERRTLPGLRTRIVRNRRRLRETKNEYYCRLLGLDPRENDVAGRVRALLSP